MVRFLHTGDWQLGMTRRFLSAEAQARFTAARIDAIRTLGAIVRAESCAFVVVSGDVFESNHVDRQVVLRALEALGEVPVPVYLLPGNHDPLDPASLYHSPTFVTHCPEHVTVLDADTVATPVDGVEVLGAPWTSKRPLTDLVTVRCAQLEPAGVLRVVVGHGAVDYLAPSQDDPALIAVTPLEEAIASGCVHYVALGDRHSVTEVGKTGRVWYSGAPEPTDFDEVAPGEALVVDLDPADITVTRHPVASWRFVRHRFDVNSRDDVEAVGDWLAALPDKDRAIVRLAFVGTLTLRDAARLDELLDHHRALLAALDDWSSVSDLVTLPDDADFADLDLTGFAADATAELRTAAADDPVARDALALLHRLAAGAA